MRCIPFKARTSTDPLQLLRTYSLRPVPEDATFELPRLSRLDWLGMKACRCVLLRQLDAMRSRVQLADLDAAN